MTKREFLNAVIASAVDNDVASFAVSELEKLDARNARRSEKPSKTQIANEPIIKAISEILTNEPMLASRIAELCGISTQKASALVKKVEGVSVTDVKVKGKGTQKGYYFEGQSFPCVWWARISPTPLLSSHCFPPLKVIPYVGG